MNTYRCVTPLIVVWSENTSHRGPYGGCDLSVYERDAEDSPPVWSRSFKRQIAQISEANRTKYEKAALSAAREILRECHETGLI